MFFSIVIPIHNSEKYLKQCLNSILNQKYSNYEIILVNDGSNDSSGAICDLYCKKDPRFRVIHRKQGKGAASARNAGTNLATGDYVIYIDSDDYIEDDNFLSDINFIAENGIDIICYKFRKYFENTNEFKSCNFIMPKYEANDTIGDYASKLVKSDAFYCAPWTKAIRRQILLDANVTFKEGLSSEDQEWYYHVLTNAKTMIGIDKSYIIYRQHSNSTSVSWTMKNLRDTIGIIKFWKSKIESIDLPTDYKCALLNSLAKLYCNLLIGYTRFDNSSKKEEYETLKSMSSLIRYHLNPRVAIFYKVYKLFGFSVLMLFLCIIDRVRS